VGQTLSRNLLGTQGISPLKYLQSNFISDAFIATDSQINSQIRAVISYYSDSNILN